MVLLGRVVPMRAWGTTVTGSDTGDTESISSSHSGPSQDTSPSQSPRISRKFQLSSGDELDNEETGKFTSCGGLNNDGAVSFCLWSQDKHGKDYTGQQPKLS